MQKPFCDISYGSSVVKREIYRTYKKIPLKGLIKIKFDQSVNAQKIFSSYFEMLTNWYQITKLEPLNILENDDIFTLLTDKARVF